MMWATTKKSLPFYAFSLHGMLWCYGRSSKAGRN